MEVGDELKQLVEKIDFFNKKQLKSRGKQRRTAANHKRCAIRAVLALVTSHRVTCWRAGYYDCRFDDALKEYCGTNVRNLVPDLFQIQTSCHDKKTIQVQPPTPPRNLTRLQCATNTSTKSDPISDLNPTQRSMRARRALTFQPNKTLVMFPVRHTSACKKTWKGNGPHYCYIGCMLNQECKNSVNSEMESTFLSIPDPPPVLVDNQTVVEKCGCGKKIVSLFAKAVKANFGAPVTNDNKAGNVKNVIDCITRKFRKRKYSIS